MIMPKFTSTLSSFEVGNKILGITKRFVNMLHKHPLLEDGCLVISGLFKKKSAQSNFSNYIAELIQYTSGKSWSMAKRTNPVLMHHIKVTLQVETSLVKIVLDWQLCFPNLPRFNCG